MSTVGQATADHDRVHCAAQKFICRSIRFFGYSGVVQPCRHARGRTQITRSGPARAAVLAIGLPLLTAGVCAPAVKDFAAVRNVRRTLLRTRSRGHRPSWPTGNPAPQTWKACWRQPLRSSNLPSSAACGYEWITWCSIKIRSTTLADLPTCSDSSRRSCREQMACTRSGPCLARARRLSRRRGCGTTAGNSGETDRPSSGYRCR